MYDFVLSSTTTNLFLGRMLFEGVALVAGWAFLRAVGGLGEVALARAKRSEPHSLMDEARIKEDFQRVLGKLE